MFNCTFSLDTKRQKKGGNVFYDSRPLVRMNVSVSVEKKGKIETGSYGFGGRHMYEKLFEKRLVVQREWLRDKVEI